MIGHPILKALRAVYDRVVLFLCTAFVTFLVSANSFFNRVRMSHENGILLKGTVTILDNPKIPAHEFFVPGAKFPCRLRHAAASFKDDAKLVVFGASLKLADERIRSPLDILLNTGTVPLFWNARTFMEFMWVSTLGKGKHYVPYLVRHPVAAYGGGDSVRRVPESYADLIYRTKTVSGFIGRDDGSYYYARYRLVGAGAVDEEGNEKEGGEQDSWDRDHAWLQNPRAGEPRGRNYLKDKTREAIEKGGEKGRLRYTLQIQLRPRPPNEDIPPEWLSSAIPWDEEKFPNLDLADIVITEVLPYHESQHTWFELDHHPRSLPIPKARSIDDPHSLNHLRAASVWARRARLLSYRVFGMPEEFPSTRHAPDWVGIPPLLDPPGPPPRGRETAKVRGIRKIAVGASTPPPEESDASDGDRPGDQPGL